MPEPTTIGAAIGALTSVGKKIQALVKLGLDAKVEAAVMDLRSEVRAAQDCTAKAQAEYLALLDKVAKLKKEAVKAEEWATQRQRYERKDFGCGTFAHVLKPGMADGEEPHRVCTHCYEEGRISSLQHRHHNRGQETVWCATHGVIRLGCPGEPPQVTTRRPRRLY
jgi:hypothetical protein